MKNIKFFKIVHKENEQAKNGEYTIPCHYPLEQFLAKEIAKEEAFLLWNKKEERVYVKEVYYSCGLRESKQPIPADWNWIKKEKEVYTHYSKLDCEIGYVDVDGYLNFSWDSICNAGDIFWVERYNITSSKDTKIFVSSFEEAINLLRSPLYTSEEEIEKGFAEMNLVNSK